MDKEQGGASIMSVVYAVFVMHLLALDKSGLQVDAIAPTPYRNDSYV